MKKRFILAPLAVGIYSLYRHMKMNDLPNPDHEVKNLNEVGLSKHVVKSLPRWGYYAGGKPMEWMNIIIVGTEDDLVKTIEKAGWYSGDPVTPWVLLKALWAIITGGQYLHGPFTPIFVGKQRQKLSYQKPTDINKFIQRHHARFWPTDNKDESGKTVWIAHASYDIGLKNAKGLQPPVHEIDADIDAEREVIAGDMVRAGARLRGYIQFQPAGGGVNAYGDDFHSDGRAAVLEVS